MVESVKGAATKNKSESDLIYVQTFNDGFKYMEMTTCDGYKVFTNKCELIDCTEMEIYIPVIKIPKDADEETIIIVDKEQIVFNFGNVTMTYKRGFGKFGNMQHYFDQENKFEIMINPKFLKEALSNIKSTVTLQFLNDEQSVIIQNTENKAERKFILLIKRNKYREEIENASKES